MIKDEGILSSDARQSSGDMFPIVLGSHATLDVAAVDETGDEKSDA